MGKMIAQDIQVRLDPIDAYRLPCGGGAGERLIADGDPQPVQDPAVAGLPAGPGGVTLIPQRLDRAGQGH